MAPTLNHKLEFRGTLPVRQRGQGLRTSFFSDHQRSALRLHNIAQTLASKCGTALFVLVLLPMTLYGQRSSNLAGHAVDVQMRNILYHFTDKISVHIRVLHGQLIPMKGELPVFDDKNSFVLKISSTEIAITPASLANVLNSYVFAKSDAPLKGISVEIDRDRLKISVRKPSWAWVFSCAGNARGVIF